MMQGISAEELDQLATAARRDPLRFYRPTRVAEAMLADDSDVALMRGPNQAGKTTALAAWVCDFLLGRGRWNRRYRRPRTRPVTIWIVCCSWSGSTVVADKIHDMMPQEEVHPDTTFSKKTGYGSNTLMLKSGSMAVFKTINQGEEGNLEGATLHAVVIDEPPPESVWDPLVARVSHHNGPIRIFMCPQGGGMGWLRRKVDDGTITDHHFALTLKDCWPVGAMRPFRTQANIDAHIQKTSPNKRPQRIYGEWEGPPDGSFFPDYNPDLHWTDAAPPGIRWKVALGVDYGTAPGKPAVSLVAVLDGKGHDPRVWFMDEATCPPDTSWNEADLAREIKAMLERNSLPPEDIDAWRGDRPVVNKRGITQSNARLWGFLRERYPDLPGQCRFAVPRKFTGSVLAVCDFINGVFARGKGRVRRRCVGLNRFFTLFDGDPHHSTKDVGDAARYALMALVHPRWYGGHPESKST